MEQCVWYTEGLTCETCTVPLQISNYYWQYGADQKLIIECIGVTTGLHPGAQSVYIIEIHVACLGPSCSAAQVYALFVEISVLCKVRQSMYHTIRVSNLYVPQGKV